MNDIIMGVGIDEFPEQAPYERVLVCFNFHAGQTIEGVVVRNDMTTPGKMIIKLADGRFVLSTECHYSPIRQKGTPTQQ